MDALPDNYYPVEPLTQQCVEEVIQESGIHPDVLFAIMMVEGGKVGEDARRKNSNGTYDIGLMQINSIHLPELAKLGISETALRNSGCISLKVAAWHILYVTKNASYTADPDEYLRGLSAYHTFSDEFNAAYAERLKAAFARIYQSD